MYCEWPELRRCCFCLPLRRGILILAYLNIVLCITQVVAAGVLGFALPYNRTYLEVLERPPFLYINQFFIVLDLSLTGVLIFGLHTKRDRFVRIYYHFMIGTLSALFLLTVIDICLSKYAEGMVFTAINFAFVTVGNGYMLLLIHSMMKKLQSEGNTFDNQLAEVKEDAPEDNGQTHTITIN